MIQRRQYVSGIYFVVVVCTLILRILYAVGFPDYFKIDSSYLFTLIVQIFCFGILPVSLYLLFSKRFINSKPVWQDFTTSFNLNKKPNSKNLLRIIAIGFIVPFTATFLSSVWQDFIAAFGYTRAASASNQFTNGIPDLLLEIVMVAVLPGVFEELTHRGLLFGGYSRPKGNRSWLVIPFTAIMFSLMHQNITQTFYTFYDGLILGAIVYYTGSIYGAMIVHFMNNLFSVLGSYAAVKGGLYAYINMMYNTLLNSWGVLVFLLLALFGMYLIFLMLRGMREDSKVYRRVGFGNQTVIIHQYQNLGAAKLGPALSIKEHIFTLATFVLGIGATLFTFIWGVLR